MKNRILIFALGFFILTTAVLLLRLVNHKPEPPSEIKSTSIIDDAKIEAKKIAETVDKKGYIQTVFERKDAIIGKGDLSKLPISQSVLDSLRLDNITKDKKLQQASVINATLVIDKMQAVKTIDSLKRTRFSYADDFFSIVFTPDSSGGHFDANAKVKLIRHDYQKRKNIFSKYKQYTDILSPDKRVLINGLQTLTVEPPKPSRIGVGLQAGYYYNASLKQFMPAVGVGISYNILQF